MSATHPSSNNKSSYSGSSKISSLRAATVPVRPLSLRWTTADIAVAAALGVACGVIFWGYNFAYAAISPFLAAILPGVSSILHAVWYFSGPLAMLIVRKPGAAMFVNAMAGAAEMVLGNQYGITLTFISAIVQGLFAEVPFYITRFKIFNLPITVVSGFCVAVEYGFYLLLFRYQGVALLSPRGLTHMTMEIIGGVLIAGVCTWYLFVAIARTGALDKFASGRAVRARVQ
ncbi:Hydroxymethylpyrimidine transport system permease protein [Bifidobacterium dolichotidis]|uniref:Hydroxymethylpyrimidine transport system permease protein n=1 Tax=Bifidobacterium dolichotidis TaxID=2306976 RepID=A0A430FPW1_9BIFI|nr:ECF transporter S component [Bifidobacterium dolichotidis]RSX54877.1 Hydroxymethylpyrimidine transport system permease protein [Bifidobacterium dolichotidis]